MMVIVLLPSPGLVWRFGLSFPLIASLSGDDGWGSSEIVKLRLIYSKRRPCKKSIKKYVFTINCVNIPSTRKFVYEKGKLSKLK